MAVSQLDPSWWKQNAPKSIATGEVQKALADVAKLKTGLKKDRNPEAYFKGLDKLIKTAIPKDEAAAKKGNDKDAAKVLGQVKSAAESEIDELSKQLLTVVSTAGKGTLPGSSGGIAVPEPKEVQTAAPGGGGEVDTIVNLAKGAWEIIKENAPSATAKTAYCQAMPSKAPPGWEELSGWQSKSAEWGYQCDTNLDAIFGTGPTIDIKFHLEYDWGGRSSKVAGLFLNNYTVWCKSIDVGWGWTVNVDATTQGNPKNIGSEGKPVGAIQLRVALKVASKLQDFGQEWGFTCGGDGSFKVS